MGRYNNRRRSDPAHDVGDSMPGTTGHSEGTFHDRALQDANVIVDGEVVSMDDHRQQSSDSKNSTTSRKSRKSKKSKKHKQSSQTNRNSVSQSDLVGKTVEVTISRPGGTAETLAEYENHQIHVNGGSPGETVLVELSRGHGYLRGAVRTHE